MSKIIVEQFITLTLHFRGENFQETMANLQRKLGEASRESDIDLPEIQQFGDTFQMELPQDDAAEIVSIVHEFCREQAIEMETPELYFLFMGCASILLKQKRFCGMFLNSAIARETLLERALKPFNPGPHVVLYTIVGPDNVVAEGSLNVAAP